MSDNGYAMNHPDQVVVALSDEAREASGTPRTDEAAFRIDLPIGQSAELVHASLARELERELETLTREHANALETAAYMEQKLVQSQVMYEIALIEHRRLVRPDGSSDRVTR